MKCIQRFCPTTSRHAPNFTVRPGVATRQRFSTGHPKAIRIIKPDVVLGSAGVASLEGLPPATIAAFAEHLFQRGVVLQDAGDEVQREVALGLGEWHLIHKKPLQELVLNEHVLQTEGVQWQPFKHIAGKMGEGLHQHLFITLGEFETKGTVSRDRVMLRLREICERAVAGNCKPALDLVASHLPDYLNAATIKYMLNLLEPKSPPAPHEVAALSGAPGRFILLPYVPHCTTDDIPAANLQLHYVPFNAALRARLTVVNQRERFLGSIAGMTFAIYLPKTPGQAIEPKLSDVSHYGQPPDWNIDNAQAFSRIAATLSRTIHVALNKEFR